MPILHVEKLRGKRGKEEIKVTEVAHLPEWGAEADLTVVGKPFARVEGAEKVTGRARYSGDIRRPGQLYARVLRSPHAHARIRRIDTSRAERLAGVHAVLSAASSP